MNSRSKALNGFEKRLKEFFSFKTNEKLGIIIALFILIVISSIISPQFLSFKNLLNILKQNTMLGVATIAMTVVIIGGSIDLSVGTTVALCGLVAGYLKDMPFIVILLTVLSLGAFIGFINGYLIAKRKLEPFIATLSMQISVRGLCLFLTGGSYIARVDSFTWIGNGYWGPIPIPAVILVFMFVIFQIVMTKTVYGKSIYAIGGNMNAAKLSGIRTDRIKILTYITTGALCAFAAIINVARITTAEPLAAVGLEGNVIAASLVGGNSLLGGRGSMTGTFIGFIIFAIISNLFNLIGLKAAEQQIIKGMIIVFAVLWSQRRKAKKL